LLYTHPDFSKTKKAILKTVMFDAEALLFPSNMPVRTGALHNRQKRVPELGLREKNNKKRGNKLSGYC
jgi:hypothetical protein